jgi:hypothetical protein
MSNLLSKIKNGSNNFVDVLFPGTSTLIRIKLLSNQDTLDATLAADKIFKASDVPVTFQNVNTYENEKTVQLLFRSCRNPDNGEPIAADVTEFRRLLSNEERSALIDEYNALAQECNPSPMEMDPAEFDALIAQVKKNIQETIGNISNLQTLRKLSRYLAEELLSLQKDNGPTSS